MAIHAFFAALLFHLGVCFASLRMFGWSAFSLVTAIAIVGLFGYEEGARYRVPEPIRKRPRIVITSFFLCVLWVSYWQMPWFGAGGPFGSPNQGEVAAEQEPVARGLILRPRRERIKLVAPVARQFHWRETARQEKQTQLIPFDGVYWVYQPPFWRPPAGSPEREGDPVLLAVRSNDESPIRLAAVQTLAKPLPFTSASRLSFVLRPSVRKPERRSVLSFQARLVLRHRAAATSGVILFAPADPVCGQEECTLDFSQPTTRSLSVFDEIVLTILPHYGNQSEVPRIALLGFRLI